MVAGSCDNPLGLHSSQCGSDVTGTPVVKREVCVAVFVLRHGDAGMGHGSERR
jgi:hypothetical protein